MTPPRPKCGLPMHVLPRLARALNWPKPATTRSGRLNSWSASRRKWSGMPDLGIPDHFLLDADQEFNLPDLVVAGFGQFKALASLGKTCIGKPHFGLGGVMRARHLLGFANRGRVLRGQFREAVVFLLGEREVRFGNFDRRLRLLDVFAGDVDLQGDLVLELRQARFLPFEFRVGKLKFA